MNLAVFLEIVACYRASRDDYDDSYAVKVVQDALRPPSGQDAKKNEWRQKVMTRFTDRFTDQLTFGSSEGACLVCAKSYRSMARHCCSLSLSSRFCSSTRCGLGITLATDCGAPAIACWSWGSCAASCTVLP